MPVNSLHFMTTNDNKWQIMTIYDNSWWLMMPHDNSWGFMTTHEYSWQLTPIHYNLSQFMTCDNIIQLNTIHDNSWQFLKVNDESWQFMTCHDNSSWTMNINLNLWCCMAVYDNLGQYMTTGLFWDKIKRRRWGEVVYNLINLTDIEFYWCLEILSDLIHGKNNHLVLVFSVNWNQNKFYNSKYYQLSYKYKNISDNWLNIFQPY